MLLAAAYGSGHPSGERPASVTGAPGSPPASVPATLTASPAETPAASLPAELASLVDVLDTATTAAEILQHARLTPTECREEPPPLSLFTKCPPGARSGDLVPLFRMVDCEQGIEPAVVEQALNDWTARPRSLYAVFREEPPSGYLYNWVPRGDYGVIYRYGEGFGIVFHVAGGLIVGAGPGCGSTPEGLLQEVPPNRILLGPLASP
jgi:hypothetical protein